jgi:hypothetical protein
MVDARETRALEQELAAAVHLDAASSRWSMAWSQRLLSSIELVVEGRGAAPERETLRALWAHPLARSLQKVSLSTWRTDEDIDATWLLEVIAEAGLPTLESLFVCCPRGSVDAAGRLFTHPGVRPQLLAAPRRSPAQRRDHRVRRRAPPPVASDRWSPRLGRRQREPSGGRAVLVLATCSCTLRP